jgi:hypothetical protein
MPAYEDSIHRYYDERTGTLALIKSRSLGADVITLTALNVLVYAQLEGGIKGLASIVIRDPNARKLELGRIAPSILKWRNPYEVDRFKAMVNFDMITNPTPFANALTRRAEINGINRRSELNQMSWKAVQGVYRGFGLSDQNVSQFATNIDDLVETRNAAAHHGLPKKLASALMEVQLRDDVTMVGNVLTDASLQFLQYFSTKKHLR